MEGQPQENNKSGLPQDFFNLLNFITSSKKYRGIALVCLINEAKDNGDGTVSIVHHNPYFKMIDHLTLHELAAMFLGMQNMVSEIQELGHEKFGKEAFDKEIQKIQSVLTIEHEVEGRQFVEMTKAEQMLYSEHSGKDGYQSFYADISDKEPDHE